jgi:hypothetical protein
MPSGNMELLESMSESPFDDHRIEDYRINDGKVEARIRSDKSENKTAWRRVSPEQLSRHVKDNTAVARWLERNLGWRRLLRACVGFDPNEVCGGPDQAAHASDKSQTVH